MLKLIKHTIITLGIASGLAAAFLWMDFDIAQREKQIDICRAMVLAEVGKNQQFVDAVGAKDFLTEMTRGAK